MRVVVEELLMQAADTPGGAPEGASDRPRWRLWSKIPMRALLLACAFPLLTCGLARARDEELTKLLATVDRAESRAALERRLEQDPTATLAALPWTLPAAFPGGDWESVAGAKVHAALTGSVEAAFGRARDPRVFLTAARRDGLTPVVLGVVRALSRAPAAASADQGQADVDAFLRECAAFEDSADVRAQACEALGRRTPTRPTADALLGALGDPDARVQSASRRALEALSQKGSLAAWRGWAQGLSGPTTDVAGPELVATLGGADRRASVERVAALERALIERPDETLSRLEATLGELEALEPSVADAIRDAVGRALERTPDPAPLLAPVTTAHPAVAAGLARGLASRATRADEEAARAALAVELAVLADRPEASVRTEALRVAPALLGQHLDRAWAARLFEGLDHPTLTVRDAAWSALRAITRQTLPQSSVTWRRWWEAQAGPTHEEEEGQ